MIQEDRAWSFCVSLCMQALGGMRMVSIEQFAEGIGQMILSGHLGRAFDRVSRKTGRLVRSDFIHSCYWYLSWHYYIIHAFLQLLCPWYL